MKISTIGLDLAKNWFQVHGVDAEWKGRCPSPAAGQRGSGLFSID
jgi:hypothetical protein